MVIPERCDLLVVGGGIHGAGIARDAAGRGLSVVLTEQFDLAAATSMSSSKLIHGGLRYLEQGHIRLVREALAERERLLHVAPHLVRPLPFLLPLGARSRPSWQLRAGLWLYDHVAGRSSLPRSRKVDLTRADLGNGLRTEYRQALSYSDASGDDARLVVANARDALARGATVLTRTRCVHLDGDGRGWTALLQRNDGGRASVAARAVVNATGPWVTQFLRSSAGVETRSRVRLVKGSHLIVRRQIAHAHAFILQNDDGRVVFVIPFEQDFSMIGTTDVAVSDEPGLVTISPEEIEYLRQTYARYFADALTDDEIVWTFAGVRALHDDGSDNPSQVSRDYVLEVDRTPSGAPILSVYGGKLTTYRRLAEEALKRLAPDLPNMGPAWTATARLPGGEIPNGDLASYIAVLSRAYPNLTPAFLQGLARRHGSLVKQVLGAARNAEELGPDFGGGLTAREVDYLIEHEWATTAEDVLYRRTKAGVGMTERQRREVARYVESRVGQHTVLAGTTAS